jgi:hypothetical protein
MSLGIRTAATGLHPAKKVDKHTFSDSLSGERRPFQEAMTELRRDTVEIILRNARKPGEYVVKVVDGSEPLRPKVRGFATFLRFLAGSGIAELERKLGLRSGALAHGAHIYTVNPLALNFSNVVPEGYTDWSDGVTPRELQNLSQKQATAVTYDPNYPASPEPIIQFRILDDVPYIGQPRFVRPGQTA